MFDFPLNRRKIITRSFLPGKADIDELEVNKGMRKSRRICGFLLPALVLLFMAGPSGANELRLAEFPESLTDARPGTSWVLHDLGEMWNTVLNIGLFGDPYDNYPSCDWPGGEADYYLWMGGLYTACYGDVTIHADSIAKWSSSCEYNDYEFWCSEGFPAEKFVPGTVALEESHFGYDDWDPVHNDNPYGLMVYQENYTWGTPGYNRFMVNSMVFTHHTGDLEGQTVPDTELPGFMVAIKGDCDLGGDDPVDCHLDDMVYYDGHAIWVTDDPTYGTFEYIYDNGIGASVDDRFIYQQNPDAEYEDPEENVYYYYSYFDSGGDGLVDADCDGNGVSDHLTILAKTIGDPVTDTIYVVEPNTGLELFSDGMPENFWRHTPAGSDTTYWVVPRNISYMWDSDATNSSVDDTGEPNIDPPIIGFIGWRLLDAYIIRADQTVERPFDVYDVTIPLNHSWWNWESDPGSDTEKYNYLAGNNPDASGQTSGPAYMAAWEGDPGWPEYIDVDNPGPWPLVHEIPFALGYPVFDYRFLLSVGPVDLYEGDSLVVIGGWLVAPGLDGLRAASDNMLDAYYRGGGPGEWGVPALPPSPILFYEAGDLEVHLQWSANAESFSPFGGYRIYRSTFQPSGWQLVVDIQGTGTYSYTDSIAGVETSAVQNGFPYFYTVVAYSDEEVPIESPRSNYKKTIQGSPVSVVPSWGPVSDDWTESVTVVPNPYRGSAAWEQVYFDKIAFMGLPTMCDIHIFTMAGDHVITLEHRSWGGQSGTEYWDLVSRNNQEITSGLYIYRVETNDDHFIGKFAIIN